MKTNIFKPALLILAISVLVMSFVSSCASRTHFLTSEVVPAAQGTVQVKSDANNNYVISIVLSNLSPSTRLTPPKACYVVWLVDQNNSYRNLGQLNSSEDFMSNSLSAKFETLSSSKPSKIVITAEDEPGVMYQSVSAIILTTDYLTVK